MAVAYNQALLNPASGNGPLSHSSLDLPKFFRALSILLAKTDYVRNDMIFYWSLLTEDDDSGTERLQRKYGAMDSEKIQEANRKLLDMWYDLASNLPADMNTIINTLTNLESMILMTKEPAEIIRTISWAVTSKIGHLSQKVEQLAETMVQSIGTIGETLQLPLGLVDKVDLDDQHLGLPQTESPETIKSVRDILAAFSKLQANNAMAQLILTMDAIVHNAASASRSLHSVVQLADALKGRPVAFIDPRTGRCAAECCQSAASRDRTCWLGRSGM